MRRSAGRLGILGSIAAGWLGLIYLSMAFFSPGTTVPRGPLGLLARVIGACGALGLLGAVVTLDAAAGLGGAWYLLGASLGTGAAALLYFMAPGFPASVPPGSEVPDSARDIARVLALVITVPSLLLLGAAGLVFWAARRSPASPV